MGLTLKPGENADGMIMFQTLPRSPWEIYMAGIDWDIFHLGLYRKKTDIEQACPGVRESRTYCNY